MGYEIKQTATGGLQVWEDYSGAQSGVKQSLVWAVAVAPTNTVLVGQLPANAVICRIDVIVPVVSNAATTANVSVGLNGGSNTFFTAAQDVKTAIGTFSQAATANWVKSVTKQAVSCTYTETGTASTAGTVYVAVDFVVN